MKQLIKKNPVLLFCSILFFIALSVKAQELDLGARVQPVPLEAKFSDPGYFVWCGAPARGADGKYHLFYSRWLVKDGFHPGWAIHSEIAYAVANQPFGPYKFVNVALPPRGTNPATGKKYWDADVTHNPNIVMHKGKYLLYYTGNYGDGKYETHRNFQRVGVAIADKPGGPWRRFDQPIIDVSNDPLAFDALCIANPAAAVRPDGGLLVVYKGVCLETGKLMGGRVRWGVAMADKPEGPYIKKSARVFEAEGEEAKKQWMLAEDPFIWFSKKYGNRYYAVANDVTGKFIGDPSATGAGNSGLALFESVDGLHWKGATHPKVLDKRFLWAGGKTSDWDVARPALLFEGDEPVALFGATDGWQKNKTATTPGCISFNVQIPLRPVGQQVTADAQPPFLSKLTSGVTFQSNDAGLQRLYDAAESGLAKNMATLGGMKMITEGLWPGWVMECAAIGGKMYASRDPQIALNQQVVFVLYPRADGRMPTGVFTDEFARMNKYDQKPAEGMIWHPEPGILCTYGNIAHVYDLPNTAWETYFWVGRNRDYLQRVYRALEAYDAHLWRTRDSNGDGLLETWCTWDTGEDHSLRYLERNAPSRWPFDVPPGSPGTPDPQDPASYKHYWYESFSEKRPAPRLEEVRVPFASMDVMAWSYEGRAALSKIARELGNGREDYWRQKAQEVQQKVVNSLWVPTRNACFDRDREGKILPELTHNNLRAMLHGLFTQEMADAFIREHLLNPQEFWTYAPLTCIAINEALFRNATGNDFSGAPHALTYQRAIRALENYGHYAEVSLIGDKLLHLLQQDGAGFTTHLDPFTGASAKSVSSKYSPMMFAALEYISRMHGIHIDVESDRVWWSALDGPDFTYTQRWGDREWTLTAKEGRFTAILNGKQVFSCARGVRVVTDLEGRVHEVVGISPKKQSVTLRSQNQQWKFALTPNQIWGVDSDKPHLNHAVPFNYPYQAKN